MIKQSAYGTEPWRLVEKELDLDLLAQSESIFALSNGHLGLRGNLDEGDPHGLPGSYLNSVYEIRPLPYAEAGYGFPDDGQTAINVTNKYALYNFLSTFSGTHFVTPRTVTAEIGFHF